MAKKRLGKGLNALINNEKNEDQNLVEEIFVDQIEANPFQPRLSFEEDALSELAASIKEKGVIQPITLRKVKAERYQIVAGERRWRACKKLEMNKIPAVIRDFNDQEMMEIALIENLQREDLNPIEEAKAYQQMLENFSLTQSELADKVGKSRSNIANMVRLLNLADKVKNHLEKGTITIGHARALLSLSAAEAQIAACENIIIQDLTVRETEKYVDKLKNPLPTTNKNKQAKALSANWQQAAEKLSQNIGMKVSIKQRQKNNLLTIEIDSLEKLEQLIDNFK
ncbi:ParB/RepB/Spo0J family partition protein [Halanaerobium salsuginis]|jgi:ParB family chromosome partitioning protein|uniref:Chromosome partitioning protein, ParB family n=1 Tax=Halanaerobium salsuginis TaxID=29563 RepID=A0A1I4LB02_9FIRM|nr:ParB/RepB/Spo0J family partition protein [Halanaerobium salsuginis]SFL88215.1 chromosome partitioning protein, ParB family [Halanaerobium salsuginis]